MTTQTDLSEYDTLSDQNFNPVTFANHLLFATNSNNNELDLFTSIKRINFDINSIDSKISQISGENYQEIIEEIEKGEEAKKLYKQLDPSLDHINSVYQRLEKDTLIPFREAIKVQDALQKINNTSYLLRSVSYFLYLIQQIEEIEHSKNRDDSQNLLKLASLLSQLKNHLSDNTNLKSLKIIRDYGVIDINKRLKLIETINSNLRSINERTITNKSDEEITHLVEALFVIDDSKLIQFIQTLLSNNVIMSVNILSKTLTSPRGFGTALDDVSRKAQLISKFSNILQSIHINDQKSTILESILTKLELTSILAAFWRDIAKAFEIKFKETIQRGGPVAKSLISYKDQIKDSIKTAVVKSDPSSIKEEGIEVRMLLNSVASLDRTK